MPSSPASPGSATKRASPEKIDSSALTTSTWMVCVVSTMDALRADLLGLLEDLVDRADHVEGLLGQVIALSGHDHLEAADRLGQRHVLAGRAREHFGNVERLRQEALDLARAGHGQLVLGREFVHAENRDDVAQLAVALQGLLHRAR